MPNLHCKLVMLEWTPCCWCIVEACAWCNIFCTFLAERQETCAWDQVGETCARVDTHCSSLIRTQETCSSDWGRILLWRAAHHRSELNVSFVSRCLGGQDFVKVVVAVVAAIIGVVVMAGLACNVARTISFVAAIRKGITVIDKIICTIN